MQGVNANVSKMEQLIHWIFLGKKLLEFFLRGVSLICMAFWNMKLPKINILANCIRSDCTFFCSVCILIQWNYCLIIKLVKNRAPTFDKKLVFSVSPKTTWQINQMREIMYASRFFLEIMLLGYKQIFR